MRTTSKLALKLVASSEPIEHPTWVVAVHRWARAMARRPQPLEDGRAL